MSILQIGHDGYAIPAADLLADWFAEHPDDEEEDNPENWLPYWDADIWQLGPQPDPHDPAWPGEELPASDFPELIPDQIPGEETPLDPSQPDPDDTGDFEEVEPDLGDSYEPDPEDLLDVELWSERRAIAECCNARFS